MKVVIDIETNSLINPTEVWLIVAKDVTTGEWNVFRNVTSSPSERDRFLAFVRGVTLWIGHNWLEFDYPVLGRLLGLSIRDVWRVSLDTLILSRLFAYSAPHGSADGSTEGIDVFVEKILLKNRHSIESYGQEFGYEKLKFNDFSKYSPEMEVYCRRDVEICERVYRKYLKQIEDARNRPSIELEHQFQLVVNSLQDNGFAFNTSKARKLLEKVTGELGDLDAKILQTFPPKLQSIREIHPRTTGHGTLHRGDFRFVKDGDLTEYNGGPFCRCQWVTFNPSSHRQIITVLNQSGWRPTDKTQGHIDAERTKDLDKLEHLRIFGWKVNENNLSTLPISAPAPSRLLARRILLESRRRTLTEWLSLVQSDARIHGKFYGIGAWTHRMAHQRPNTANIPNELDINGNKKLLGKELRSLWCAPRNRLLVGVDAEGIQLRVFAHLIDDKEFTDALANGSKADKTDPHSLNQRIIGSVCKSRAAAKRFIYALLLGAGLWKLSQILECTEAETKKALDRLLIRYTGWARLKETNIPTDARRGYFTGLDGRDVSIPGKNASEKRHLCMSGYLQNGEVIVMKKASTIFFDRLPSDCQLVNLVHDEWQTECPNNVKIALQVAELQANALKQAGEQLKLRCPLTGSYWNDDAKDYTVGTNWSVTH